MSDSRLTLVNWLRNEFSAELHDGFKRLKRVPDTRVIRFLDHFESLVPSQQSELAAILADWSSYRFLGTPIPTSTVKQFTNATAFPDPAEGLRYTGVNLLAGLAKGAGQGGLNSWFQKKGIAGLAMRPPENLVRDVADLVPVKIPTLRRLVKAAFAKLFARDVKEIDDGIWRYEGTLAESSLKVMIRFSGRMGRPQLAYEVVEVRSKGRVIAAPKFCFESVLGAGFGSWDYLTQENADRSVALLCELIDHVARLPERLPEGCCTSQRK